jgi:hypothetical protein
MVVHMKRRQLAKSVPSGGILTRTLRALVCALVLVFVPSPGRAALDGQVLQTPDPKTDAPTPVTESATRAVTIAADGTLSVTATRLTLHSVLSDISVQAKLPIFLSESLENERVSLRLEAVGLEEGLKRLLAAYDAFYLFGPSESEKAKPSTSIKRVWVYPKGWGLELEPVPPTLWASTRELEAQLEDPDPGVRSDTYEALIERLGARGLPIVLRGLVDGDGGVRLGTLTAALDGGVDIPSADLHALVLSDSLQWIRLLALEAVETRPEAMSIAESVKDDQDEVIRNTARLLLERLESHPTKKPPR